MMQIVATSWSLETQPMPAGIASIQPGGGLVMRLELAWGRLRRRWLRTFRPGYVERMQQRRRGHCPDCPHDIVDARDLKFYRNVCGYKFEAADDPFQWRERLPIAREAWGEVVVLAGGALIAGALMSLWLWWPAVLVALAVAGVVVYFFRDPKRTIPTAPGLVVSPADGKVVDIEEEPDTSFFDGPSLKIGIFLSLWDVHINRLPTDATVIGLRYHPGRFLPALAKRASAVNEQMEVALQEDLPPYRRLLVRQVAGLIARRIVCGLRPGQTAVRGQKFGMIKFGSRVELILPKEEGMALEIGVGCRVKAGSTVLVRYAAGREDP